VSILDATAAALYATLKAGTALTALLSGTTSIFDMQAPDGVSSPYVIFNHQGGGPELLTSKQIEGNIWLVRGYSAVSAKKASEIFGQVDALLNKKNITISGATTFWCVREENVKQVENGPDNSKFWMAGGLYRIRTTS
jgi:hypothetical protein